MAAGVANRRESRAARWLVCLLFLTFAMTSDAVGAVVARVIDELHLTLRAASAFQYVPMGAMSLGALALGGIVDRLGYRRAIVLGLGFYGLSSLLFAWGRHFDFFLVLLGFSGLGISLFKTGAITLIGAVTEDGDGHTRLMNAAEGFFGIGSIAGPAIVAALFSAGLSWKWLYVTAACICCGLVILTSCMRVRTVRDFRQPSAGVPFTAARVRTMTILKDRHALGFAALIVLYVTIESAVYVWMPTYTRAYHGRFTVLPVYGLTAFFALRAGGRFLGLWLLHRLAWTVVLLSCGLFILLCFAGAVYGGVDAAVWLLPLSGLAMSVVYPTLNSKGISCFARHDHGAAAGVLLFFTALAAALGPYCIGMVSDAWGSIRYGFILATMLAALLVIGLLLNWAFNPAGRRLAALAAGEPAA